MTDDFNEQVKAAVAEFHPDLVILDPWSQVAAGEEGRGK